MRGRGAAVLVVLHEVGALAPLIDRAIVLRDGRVVHDGQSFAQADHLEQPVDRGGRAHHNEARPGCGGRLLGLDHGGEALGVHERDLAEVEHDLLAALDRAGQLRSEDVDGREVDVTVDGNDLRRVLR